VDAEKSGPQGTPRSSGTATISSRSRIQGLPEELALNPKLVALSKKTGIPLVATNDCHFLERGDHRAHEILLCIQTAKTVQDADRMRYSEEHYFKSGEEMERLFGDLPEAIENTARIADRCHVLLDGNKPPLPDFTVPDGTDDRRVLREVSRRGFQERLTVWKDLAAKGRLRPSARAVHAPARGRDPHDPADGLLGLLPHRLGLHQVRARPRIPVGPGRGSAAGASSPTA
jgi:DNA polymerase-3 subunit alpha